MDRKIFLVLSMFCFSLILCITLICATPPLPSYENENESAVAIASAKVLLSNSDSLLSLAKTKIENYTFFNKFFAKKIVRKMAKEITHAKKQMVLAEQSHLKGEYGSVSSNVMEVIGHATYANFNLNKIIEGRTKKNWNRGDIEDITINGQDLNNISNK